MISQESLELLGQLIAKNIREEFAAKHLTGNLVRSIEVIAEKDKVKIVINAPSYDFYKYFTQKIVVPNGLGSYASRLDESGSEMIVYWANGKKSKWVEPRNHIGYVNEVISKSIQEWCNTRSENYKVIG